MDLVATCHHFYNFQQYTVHHIFLSNFSEKYISL